MTSKQKDLTKNFFALGLMFWLYERSMDPTISWIEPEVRRPPDRRRGEHPRPQGGLRVRRDDRDVPHDLPGAEGAPRPRDVPEHHRQRGHRRSASSPPRSSPSAQLFYGSYPITPASDILHQLSGYKHFGVRTFQAEDEIAAIGAAIGASYGGALALTGTSGPGVALKQEAIGLAVMTELPLVVIDVQRAGPSTGMPTKVEQADLLMALYGRNGESPVPIVAPATPGECFSLAIEAVPDRAQVHDAGHLPVRRVRRQRRRAVAGPVAGRPARHLGRQRREGRRARSCPTTATPRRSAARGPSPARPASSTASAASRRPTAWATSATTPTTTTR